MREKVLCKDDVMDRSEWKRWGMNSDSSPQGTSRWWRTGNAAKTLSRLCVRSRESEVIKFFFFLSWRCMENSWGILGLSIVARRYKAKSEWRLVPKGIFIFEIGGVKWFLATLSVENTRAPCEDLESLLGFKSGAGALSNAVLMRVSHVMWVWESKLEPSFLQLSAYWNTPAT